MTSRDFIDRLISQLDQLGNVANESRKKVKAITPAAERAQVDIEDTKLQIHHAMNRADTHLTGLIEALGTVRDQEESLDELVGAVRRISEGLRQLEAQADKTAWKQADIETIVQNWHIIIERHPETIDTIIKHLDGPILQERLEQASVVDWAKFETAFIGARGNRTV